MSPWLDLRSKSVIARDTEYLIPDVEYSPACNIHLIDIVVRGYIVRLLIMGGDDYISSNFLVQIWHWKIHQEFSLSHRIALAVWDIGSNSF
jgi:hypothetical protein